MPDMTAVAANLALTAVASLVVFGITFVIAVAIDRHRIVDQAWGLVFVVIAVTTALASQGHGDALLSWLVPGLVTVWGLRLFLHIHLRSRGEGEDRRYHQLLERAPRNRQWYALRLVYFTQAAVAWWVSLPIQVALYSAAPATALLLVGVAIWAAGFVFETVSDAQLTRFRRHSGGGEVLRSGLWRYTRHPNYFGDACVWWGLFLLACGSWVGVATILSPVAMTYFLAAKTGKPLMEDHMRATRPDYADYVARTSGFVPWPPRS